MKLRLIAEASSRDIIPEGLFGGPQRERGNNAKFDEVSREQTAKNLVIITLHKLRKMLSKMGLLKPGSKGEPVHEPAINKTFLNLREIVKSIVSRDAQKIINPDEETDLKKIGKFWGFQIPTGYHDINAGQSGKATADGVLDGLIRKATKEVSEIQSDEKGYKLNAQILIKARILKNLGDDIWKWHN